MLKKQPRQQGKWLYQLLEKSFAGRTVKKKANGNKWKSGKVGGEGRGRGDKQEVS